jgi:hypothetical protein
MYQVEVDHSSPFVHAPALLDLAIDDAEEVDDRDRNSLPGRSSKRQRSCGRRAASRALFIPEL